MSSQRPGPTPKQIIRRLGLQKNEAEGGYFGPLYTSPLALPNEALPGFESVKPPRPVSSAIYYFLDAGSVSVLHKVRGDMIYHFYAGDPVEMLLLYPEGSDNRYETLVFGNDLEAGARPVKVVPGDTWLGSRLTLGGSYALMGVTMAPGFNPKDYAIGKRSDLVRAYPTLKNLIGEFTRS